MSFRNRLTLFFVWIVVLPMVAVAVVLFQLISREDADTRARLEQAQTTASGLYETFTERAEAVAEEIGSDPELAAAIRQGDTRAIERRLEALATERDARRARLILRAGGTVDVGSGFGLAPAQSRLVDDGRQVATLWVAVADPQMYADQAARLTGLPVVVSDDEEEVLAKTVTGVEVKGAPLEGSATLGGQEYRVVGFRGAGFGADRIRVRLLADPQLGNQDDETDELLVVGAILLAFLILAFAFALTVSRALQAQVQRLLVAARRLGRGDFDIEVPTEGNDEFAALGGEFNSMARQLQSRLDELNRERQRLQEAIRRVGQASARGLDREAVLSIVVETAVDGVGAEAGRATVRDGPAGPLREVAAAGQVQGMRQALQAVEAAALDAGAATEAHVEGVAALAQPLRPEDGGRVLGLLSAARAGGGFTEPEKELFQYLANQAALSIENVDLHEAVQRQAVTDDLTGLFNHRRFQEVVEREVERSRRYGHGVGLIMLDIDDFKAVNDSYGHLQGDLVLREVARVLRESARDIDEPARYGGEELAVVLPETDLDGAARFGERLRERIQALRIPLIAGAGTIGITASVGAAALPGSAVADKEALVAAADQALYRAKREGKNRTVRAEPVLGG